MKFFKRVFAFLIIILLIIAAIFAYIKVQTLIYPETYSVYVEKYSTKFGVDRDLVYAVIKCESSFNPEATSHVDARGLMQLTPETFDWVKSKLKDGDDDSLTANDLYTPETNIKYGVYLLSLHLDEFGDVPTVLAAYHAGRGNVNKWLDNPDYSTDGKTISTTPFKETNAYIERVQKVWDKYKNLHNNKYMLKLRDLGLI